jgi:hypothetical protein
MKKIEMAVAIIALSAMVACSNAENKILNSDENSETEQNYVPKQNSAPATNADGVRLNPPHGEPGHVCEIPVGQPLDGSGDAGTQTMEIKTELPASEVQANTTQPTGNVKLNPAHGEPGHVCEIPVGQPLPN